MKKALISICCFVFVVAMANQVFAAAFQNGDFETGDFIGWNGDLEPTGAVNPNSDSHFTIITNSGNHVAQVQNDDTDWIATLYQDFTMDSLNGPGWTMNITFWIKWQPTDNGAGNDTITALLSGSSDIDLLENVSNAELRDGIQVTHDVTALAGESNVELAFTVTDLDWNTLDYFQLDNVSFEQRPPAPVPVPGTALLLGSGLAGLLITRRKKI